MSSKPYRDKDKKKRVRYTTVQKSNALDLQ